MEEVSEGLPGNSATGKQPQVLEISVGKWVNDVCDADRLPLRVYDLMRISDGRRAKSQSSTQILSILRFFGKEFVD